MLKHILIAGAGCTFLLSANADLYIGAGAGISSTTENLNGGSNLATVLIAGYDTPILPLLKIGIEGEYNYIKTAIDINGQSGGMYSVPIYAVAKLDAPLGLNLSAKFGYAYNHFNVDSSVIPTTLWRPAAAVAVGYQLLGINLFFQSSRFFTDNRGNSSAVNSYTLGAMYSF